MAKRRAQKMVSGSYEIHLVPVKAAAGYLAGYADPEFIDELNTLHPMLAPGKYRAFKLWETVCCPLPADL